MPRFTIQNESPKKSIVKRNHLSSNLETNKKLGIELAS